MDNQWSIAGSLMRENALFKPWAVKPREYNPRSSMKMSKDSDIVIIIM